MNISDSFHFRKNSSSDYDELFASYLISKFINKDIVIGNRAEGLPDCYSQNDNVGYELCRFGVISDFIKESILYGYTKASNSNLKDDYHDKTNYSHIFKSKYEKLNNGNYGLIGDKIYLVLYNFQRLENSQRIEHIIKLFRYKNFLSIKKFVAMFVITTSSVYKIDDISFEKIVEYKDDEYNTLIKDFQKEISLL